MRKEGDLKKGKGERGTHIDVRARRSIVVERRKKKNEKKKKRVEINRKDHQLQPQSQNLLLILFPFRFKGDATQLLGSSSSSFNLEEREKKKRVKISFKKLSVWLQRGHEKKMTAITFAMDHKERACGSPLKISSQSLGKQFSIARNTKSKKSHPDPNFFSFYVFTS